MIDGDWTRQHVLGRLAGEDPIVIRREPGIEAVALRIERLDVFDIGQLVVDDVVLENYWDREQPMYASEMIELQNHGNPLYFRNIFVKELNVPPAGFVALFNGKDLSGWKGFVADPPQRAKMSSEELAAEQKKRPSIYLL